LRFSAHCKVCRLPAVSYAKMVELIEMQFGVLSQVGPEIMYYMRIWITPWERALFGGCLANWKAL